MTNNNDLLALERVEKQDDDERVSGHHEDDRGTFIMTVLSSCLDT